jgi:hypothetical protein
MRGKTKGGRRRGAGGREEGEGGREEGGIGGVDLENEIERK